MSRARTVSREYIDKYEDGQSDLDLMANKNIDWLNMPWTRPIYLMFVIIVYAVVKMSRAFSVKESWTVTNMVHAIITFILLHWIKGCPDEGTQGAYNGLTLYEQIDAGTPWTITKKFFMLVPTMITFAACWEADYDPFYCVVNCGIFLILIIAKIPSMHRVRLFGINSTVGIDSKIEYTPPRRGERYLSRSASGSKERESSKSK